MAAFTIRVPARLGNNRRAMKVGTIKYSFPPESIKLERYIRFCLGLDVKMKLGGNSLLRLAIVGVVWIIHL